MSSGVRMFVREDRGDIAVVRMTYGKVSALDAPFCDAMAQEFEQLAGGVPRAVVLTGTGSAFSAGVDLFRLLEGGADYVRVFLPSMARFFRGLLFFPKPLVAAINGHAIAGGCIMAAAADYRVMARGGGRIGVPELLVGVPFPTLPLEIVAARVAPALLRGIIYSGRTVEADEAVAVGFSDEASEPDRLMEHAIAAAERLARIPTTSFALTKRALVAPILERVARADDEDVMSAWMSDEVQSAIRAYLERTIRQRRTE